MFEGRPFYGLLQELILLSLIFVEMKYCKNSFTSIHPKWMLTILLYDENIDSFHNFNTNMYNED